MKLILVICLYVCMISQAAVVDYGHFIGTDLDLLIHEPTEINWNDYNMNYPIVNIRGSVIDGIYYEPYAYSIPEPATIALILSGIIAVRRMKNV